MENETFFFFLITYTYRFSHLLAKLCREHFKDELDLPEVSTSMGNPTQLFYSWKHFAVSAPLRSLNGFTGISSARPNYSKELHIPTGSLWNTNTDGFYWHLRHIAILLLWSWAEFNCKQCLLYLVRMSTENTGRTRLVQISSAKQLRICWSYASAFMFKCPPARNLLLKKKKNTEVVCLHLDVWSSFSAEQTRNAVFLRYCI